MPPAINAEIAALDVTAPACVALPGATRAQAAFPTKPISLIVPFGPGGMADLTAPWPSTWRAA